MNFTLSFHYYFIATYPLSQIHGPFEYLQDISNLVKHVTVGEDTTSFLLILTACKPAYTFVRITLPLYQNGHKT